MKFCWNSRNPMPFVYRLGNFIAWLALRSMYRIRVYGQDHFYNKAAIIAANHVSFLDPPILGICSPEEVHYLARQSLFKVPVFGKIISKINAHPLKGDVGDVGVIKTICHLLEQGKKIILFPEGSRSYDNKFAPVKPGMSLLVSRTNTAVIPAYVFGTFEAWPRKNVFPRPWKTIGCVFGTPILWETFSHLGKKEAQLAFAQSVTEAIEGLRKWYERGAKGSPP